MKRTALLHAELSEVIARLGHGDLLVIADAGLPVPEFADGPRRIDLAVTANVPRLLDVLDAVLAEMQVEGAVVATELAGASPALHAQLLRRFGSTQVETLSHEAFKQATRGARAIVRTGEFTPYANVILRSGVVF
jgi:D-ribose pyranase